MQEVRPSFHNRPAFPVTARCLQHSIVGVPMNLFPRCNWIRNVAARPGRRALRMNVWMAVALLALAAGRASAAVHPVPLDPNVDSKKCLECHEDTAKGKSVHSAMATGCLSCHEVRVNKDITRVKLITATPSSLCVSCHADKT